MNKENDLDNPVIQAIEGMELKEHPDREIRLSIRNGGYLKGEDGRYLISGKWYTLDQAVTREKRMRNLKPFEPDNEWGKRKKDKTTSKEILETLMNMRIRGEDLSGVEGFFSASELIHTNVVKQALNGNLNAYNAILDRMEGKAIPKVEGAESDSEFKTTKLSDLISFAKLPPINEQESL